MAGLQYLRSFRGWVSEKVDLCCRNWTTQGYYAGVSTDAVRALNPALIAMVSIGILVALVGHTVAILLCDL